MSLRIVRVAMRFLDKSIRVSSGCSVLLSVALFRIIYDYYWRVYRFTWINVSLLLDTMFWRHIPTPSQLLQFV